MSKMHVDLLKQFNNISSSSANTEQHGVHIENQQSKSNGVQGEKFSN